MYPRMLCSHAGKVWRFAICTAVILGAVACGQSRQEEASLPPAAHGMSLTLLHTNDTHSVYGGVTREGLPCYEGICGQGSGGHVRLDQAVRAIRRDRPDALFLDAGDIFQGTLFWSMHRETMPLRLMDGMGYQALAPGNHEFDAGLSTWFTFVAGLQTPVLAANIVLDPLPAPEAARNIHPFVIREQDGRKIGIVGLITEETPQSSSPGPGIIFTDARKALEDAVRTLTGQGVDIIIVLAHLGLDKERDLARSVDGVDIVVGGHSHSLLGSGSTPGPDGPYPIVETTPCGDPALVVTAGWAARHLGRLDVDFDAKGVARQWSGETILLNEDSLARLGAPERSKELEALIRDFAAPIQEEMQNTIGRIHAPDIADGSPLEAAGVGECRKRECLSGNIMADAMRAAWRQKDAPIALLNGGGVRNSLPAGTVTRGHVLGALPFRNELVQTRMRGEALWQALEHSVARYEQNKGAFLQVSGLRYAFDPSQEKGKRITHVSVREEDGNWRPLQPEREYAVTTVEFLAKGGDGFTLFTPLDWTKGAGLDDEAVTEYIRTASPVTVRLEGRIAVAKQQ